MKTTNEKPLMSKDAKTISLRHWLDYIQAIHEKAVDFDLVRLKEVAQKGGFAEQSAPIIIVGGTNGKGSTTALTAKFLSSCGYRVGCYFSPHLQYFNERIVINGKPVDEHLICKAFAKVEKARGNTSLTYFEFTTLAALELFKNQSLDAIVLEVGCGGEKDAVNIVDPALSIITNVSIDHTEWLGKDVNEIALTKAGIFRTDKPAIVGIKGQKPTLLEKAKDLKTKLYLEGQSFGWHDKYKSYWQFNGKYIKVPESSIPSTSISLSLAALEVLKPILPKINEFPLSRLSYILRVSQLPGRFQRIMTKCETILDVAHNEAGSRWLARNLKKLPGEARHIAVWSSFNDKDLKAIVAPMIDLVDTWVIAPMQHVRGAKVQDLQDALEALGAKSIERQSTLALAFQKAETLSGKHDRVVVFGSFGTVGEVLASTEHDYQTMRAFFVPQNLAAEPST